jgi:hypothetical protein
VNVAVKVRSSIASIGLSIQQRRVHFWWRTTPSELRLTSMQQLLAEHVEFRSKLTITHKNLQQKQTSQIERIVLVLSRHSSCESRLT